MPLIIEDTSEDDMTEKPPNIRPYRAQHEPGDERVTETLDDRGVKHRQTWRQVGWHGQTGAFYSLTEDPSRHEPGSFSPLWLLVDDEEILADWERELILAERPGYDGGPDGG